MPFEDRKLLEDYLAAFAKQAFRNIRKYRHRSNFMVLLVLPGMAPALVLIYDRAPYYVRQADGNFAGLVGAPIAQAL